MRRMLVVIAAGAFVALATVPGDAHHAFSAEFDANRPMHLEGVVVRMEWINPHAGPRDYPRWDSLDGRRWHAKYLAASRLHEELAASGHRDHRGRIPGKRRV